MALFPKFSLFQAIRINELGVSGETYFLSNDIICFDKKIPPSHMLVRTGEMKRFDYTNDSEKAFIPLRYGGKRCWMEDRSRQKIPTDEFLTVLKSNSENKAYVQKFRCSSGME